MAQSWEGTTTSDPKPELEGAGRPSVRPSVPRWFGFSEPEQQLALKALFVLTSCASVYASGCLFTDLGVRSLWVSLRWPIGGR